MSEYRSVRCDRSGSKMKAKPPRRKVAKANTKRHSRDLSRCSEAKAESGNPEEGLSREKYDR
jgi:hypothetical protein